MERWRPAGPWLGVHFAAKKERIEAGDAVGVDRTAEKREKDVPFAYRLPFHDSRENQYRLGIADFRLRIVDFEHRGA